MSMAFTNSEKQARYRERHLGIDGEKVRVGLILNATTRTKMERLARHKGYTITALVEELIKSGERRVISRLTGKALKQYYDGE
jgi:predicted DNA-binding ribbon-helix-helix protein